ncbi:MAG: type II toxin-antitoxin system RelE/ParE family toxin [Geminicoccaceae bacterium]
MTRYRLVRHPLVTRDIERIVDFLLEYTSADAIATKLARLETDIEALADQPWRGTGHNDILEGLRILPSAHKGLIAFTIDEPTRTVKILSITWTGAN